MASDRIVARGVLERRFWVVAGFGYAPILPMNARSGLAWRIRGPRVAFGVLAIAALARIPLGTMDVATFSTAKYFSYFTIRSTVLGVIVLLIGGLRDPQDRHWQMIRGPLVDWYPYPFLDPPGVRLARHRPDRAHRRLRPAGSGRGLPRYPRHPLPARADRPRCSIHNARGAGCA
ncbi:hypothetical protein [Nocardia sp. NPDC050710]|uniref:hypothetical protein n=1 Tax=Nocardia sp. NPDC050710 TaxID=3157220 RepID=UPI0033DE530C